MRIFQYEQVVSHWTLQMLKTEVEFFNEHMDRNAWIGLFDEPDNPIEQFILDSYDFHFSDKCNNVVGFEWWIHVMEKSDQMILFHADHDEYLRAEKDEMKYPMLGTCMYLDDDPNPTVFLDTQQTSIYEKQIEPFPPTNAVFSYAEEGKFLVYDPRYIHGVLPGSDKQTTLWYNIWDYKPDNLKRVGISREGYKNSNDNRGHFIVKERKEPVLFLGETISVGLDVHQKPMTLKGPRDPNGIGNLWQVKQ